MSTIGHSGKESNVEKKEKEQREEQNHNKVLVLKMFEDQDSKNFESLRDLLSDNLVAVFPGVEGQQDLNAFLLGARAFYEAFPDGHHTFDEVIAEGDKVVTAGTFSGTNRGSLQGMPPTGRRISMPVMHVDTVHGGKIVRHRGVANFMDLMQQLGAIPPTSPPRRQ
jgi:predicted ester cyclase